MPCPDHRPEPAGALRPAGWLECQALVAAGYQVAVVCPKGSGDPAYEVIDGVELYKYRPYAPGGSKLGFVAEYVYSFLATAWLTLKARRSGRFAVIQACNPPDIFWPIAPALSRHRRHPVRFRPPRPVPRALRVSFSRRPEAAVPGAARPGAPDSPDGGPRDLHERLLPRHRHEREAASRPPTSRSSAPGPDPQRLRRGPADPALRRGRRFLAAYIGVMGPQDGVDIVVRAADIVVHELGRDDIAFTLIGSGDCFDDLVALRDELGLAGYVEFTGRAPDELVARILSTADVGLSPDPKNPLNDVSTMNKTMEYMAFELPWSPSTCVRLGFQPATPACTSSPTTCTTTPRQSCELMDDEPKRCSAGQAGRARVEQELAWSHQERAYLGVYQRLTSGAKRVSSGPGAEMCGIAGCYQQADGQKLVDIMSDRIAHRGPDATRHLEPRGRPRGGAARPPPALDHRPERGGRPAAAQGRPDASSTTASCTTTGRCGPS